MRATVLFGAGDIRIEGVPDARLVEPTDAVVRVTRACTVTWVAAKTYTRSKNSSKVVAECSSHVGRARPKTRVSRCP